MLRPLCGTLLFLIAFQPISFAQSEVLYSANSIPEELNFKSNAVIRLSDLTVEVQSKTELNITERRVVTVLNEQGNSAIQAFAGYDKYNKIKKIEARIFNENGDEIEKFKERDFADFSAVDGGTLYSDSRVLVLNYMPVSYPYTVEFICEIQTPNTAGIPSWRPINSYYTGIQNSSYKVIENEHLGLRFKEKNLVAHNVSTSIVDNKRIYKIENIKPFLPEDLSPSLRRFTPEVLTAANSFYFYGVEGKAENWKEFGDWVNDALLAERNSVTEETKQKIAELTSGISDPIEKAKLIFDFVQNNTRYISVQVGIGGVQPIPALEVDKLKYGDCKGLTNYTKALFELADIESYYSVVQAGRDIVDLEEDFASLEQGNHIILAVPDGEKMIWLDCTSQVHPFNFIGDFTDNRNVLVVKPDSSEIIKTQKYSDTINHQRINAKIKISSDGMMTSDLMIKTKGIQYDNRFFIETQPAKDITEYYKELWGYVNNLEVKSFSFNNDKSEVEFTESVLLSASDYFTESGAIVLFKPNVFNQNSFVPDRYRNRQLPLEIARGYLDEDVFEIDLPNDFKIEAIPDDIFIETKFGSYQIEIKVDTENNSIKYKRKLHIKSGEYPKEEYSNYRDFRKQISKGDKAKVVLKKT